jgi:hypothetical protein
MVASHGGKATATALKVQPAAFPLSQFAASWDNIPTVSITAIVQDNTIKLPVQVPDGTQVEVVLPTETPVGEFKSTGSFFDSIRDLVGSVEGPTDWAAEHDHYIHGTPKRGAK